MNITGQRWPVVLSSTASLAVAGSTGGSMLCSGYARIVGIHIANASAKAGSGVRIWQSADNGTNWDYFTDAAPTACSGSIFSACLHGNAVKVEIRTDSAASLLRTLWTLRPL